MDVTLLSGGASPGLSGHLVVCGLTCLAQVWAPLLPCSSLLFSLGTKREAEPALLSGLHTHLSVCGVLARGQRAAHKVCALLRLSRPSHLEILDSFKLMQLA